MNSATASDVFRSHLKTAAASDLAALNKGRAADECFLSVEDEIARMAMVSLERLGEAEARRWARHPDERVVCLFMRLLAGSIKESLSSMERPDFMRDYNVMEDLTERAMREAGAEGLLWTPLLDMLVEIAGENWQVRQGVNFKERLVELGEWLARVEDPEQVRPLIDFPSAAVRNLVLTKARTIPGDLLPELIRRAYDVIRILNNDELLHRHGESVLLHMLKSPRQSFQGIAPLMERANVAALLAGISASVQDEMVSRARANEHWETLGVLLPMLLKVSPSTLRELMSAREGLLPPVVRNSVLTHPRLPADLRERLLQGEFGFAPKLVSHSQADAKLLEAAYLQEGKSISRAVIQNPNVSDALARRIMGEWSEWPEGTDGRPPALFRPAVALYCAHRIPRVSAHMVLEGFVQDERWDEDPLASPAIEALVRATWREGPHKGEIELLRKWARRNCSIAFGQDLLSTALMDSDPQIREAAYRLTGYIRPMTAEERRAVKDWQALIDAEQRSVSTDAPEPSRISRKR